MTVKKSDQKMNIVIVGHVDHGKSTVIGRLLADTGSLPEGKLDKVKAECERNAKPFEYAFLLDALKDEQSQGITIDSARCFFRSRAREYIIIDAPGHIEFLKNMVSGAARAEAALLVIDAKEGIRENSKRHGYLLSMLGIRQIAVLVNKMDLVNYDRKVFDQIEKDYRVFLKKIGITPHSFIPIAAREGKNIVAPSPAMKWFKGSHVISVLDEFKKAPPLDEKPFRMPVQGIYKFTEAGDDRRIIAGRVESGTIQVGDQVVFLPSNKRSEISSIESFGKVSPGNSAAVGQSTGFTVKEQIYIQRGDVMCKMKEALPLVSPLIVAEIFWMGRRPLQKDKDYLLKIGTAKVTVTLKEVRRVIDATELKKSKKTHIERHDVAEIVLECASPIAFDLAANMEATGRFVIVDNYDIAGGGIISAMLKDEQAEVREQVQQRLLKWDFSIIGPRVRAKAYGHGPKLVLLTGNVGVDKKTIAKQLEKKLFERGIKTYFLGIGNLLRGLDSDMEQTRRSRHEHVRRLGEVAHMFIDAGLVVLATASKLNDEELKLLQEVVDRDAILIVNVGKNEFREGIVDLNLPASGSTVKNIESCLNLLTQHRIIIS